MSEIIHRWRSTANGGTFQYVDEDHPLPTTGGGGGGGGAVTIASGADVVEGTLGDTQAAGTVVGYLKSLWTNFYGTPQAIKVDGSAVTQPISAAALPLPTGAATAAKQPAIGTAGSASADVITVQGIAGGTAQPMSAASLPLPAGASTAAKQPTLGTAGTPSSDVLTIQGAVSMTKLLVTPDSVALPANQSVNVSQINAVTPLMGNGVTGTGSQRVTLASDNSAVPAAGQGATGASVPANATQAGARGATANPTAVTDGQLVSPMADKLGKLVTVDAIRTLKKSQKTSISNTTAETTIVTAGVANIFNDVFKIILSNTGASATKVDIRDATAGSIIETLYCPAGEMRGWSLPAGSAYQQTTAANNWTAQCGTATTALEVTVQFVQNI